MISLTDIFTLVDAVSRRGHTVTDLDLETLASETVLCEYPALGDVGFLEQYPSVNDETLRHRVETDSVAAYRDDWRVISESNGTTMAEYDGEEKEVTAAPDDLLSAAEAPLDDFTELSGTAVSSNTAARLEQLGYR